MSSTFFNFVATLFMAETTVVKIKIKGMFEHKQCLEAKNLLNECCIICLCLSVMLPHNGKDRMWDY